MDGQTYLPLMMEWSSATMDVTPAQAGVQESREGYWIPAFAGMTWSVPWFNGLFNHQ